LLTTLPSENWLNCSTPLQSTESAWFAVHTRSNFERKTVLYLHEKSIHTFLPSYSTRRKWSDRECRLDRPLFPGYVFVHIVPTPDMRVTVLRTIGITEFVGNRGVGSPIPDSEIQAIQTVLNERVAFELCPYLKIGQCVRVRGGCLDGIEGILVGVNGDQSLVISVQSIERSLMIRIKGYDIEQVGWSCSTK
jgi:transcription antitermination factor NusG